MFLLFSLSVFVSHAAFGGGYGGGFGMPMMQSPFSTLPGVAEKRGAVAMVFSDGLDSKPLEQFIAAGMLPRYAPMSTDGHDMSEMWLSGLTGQTEDQVIAQAKMHFPMSAMLRHPENEELMPEWGQVLRLGLTTAPDKPASQNTQTAGGFHPAMFGESEMPEFGESGFNFAAAAAAFSNAGNSASGNADSTGAGSGAAANGHGMTFGFGEGFEAPEAPERPEAPEMGESGFGGFHPAMNHPAMNMFDPSEHTEDFCANQPIQNCNYPCMNLAGVCSTFGLAKAHMMKSQETSNKGFKLTAVEVLYCLWGLTTGILVGVCYMLRTRKTASKNELAEALNMA